MTFAEELKNQYIIKINKNMKKILIALDYSEATLLIAEKGKELAEAFGAEVILIHVLSDPTYYNSLNYSPITGFDSFSNLDIIQSSTIEDVRNAARKFLGRFREKMDINGAELVLGEGDFADEILKTALEKNAEIIVMGTHSRKGFDKIFMGSVAEKVLHKSHIPVFIIPIRNVNS